MSTKITYVLLDVLQVFVGDAGKSRVFRCTMKQNRKPCAVLFEENEYEEAVIEAYYKSKEKVKMPNNRYPFACIHCKTSHKDKNTVSYHRMFNLCKVYKGDKPLKMYPTWEPSEHGEKARIAEKYGKVSSPPPSSVASPTEQPSFLELEAKPSRKRTLAIKSSGLSPPTKKRILSVKVPAFEHPRRHLPKKSEDCELSLPCQLDTKDTERAPMSPPAPRRKSKPKRPPLQLKPASSEEHAPQEYAQ